MKIVKESLFEILMADILKPLDIDKEIASMSKKELDAKLLSTFKPYNTEEIPVITKKLLAAGANINARGEWGTTLLQKAADYNNYRLIEKLLAMGAAGGYSPDLRIHPAIHNLIVGYEGDPTTLLDFACKTADIPLFEKALKEGATHLKYSTLRDSQDFHKMVNYIKNHEELLKLFKKPKEIEKIKNFFNLKEPKNTGKFPSGYKSYKILKYVDEDEVYKLRQLTKFIYELNFGEDTFNPLKKWKLLSRFMGRNVMALC